MTTRSCFRRNSYCSFPSCHSAWIAFWRRSCSSWCNRLGSSWPGNKKRSQYRVRGTGGYGLTPVTREVCSDMHWAKLTKTVVTLGIDIVLTIVDVLTGYLSFVEQLWQKLGDHSCPQMKRSAKPIPLSRQFLTGGHKLGQLGVDFTSCSDMIRGTCLSAGGLVI